MVDSLSAPQPRHFLLCMVRFSVTCLKINGAWYDEGRPNVTMWGDNPPGFKTQFKIPIFIHKEDYWGNLDCYKSICGGCGLVYQYLSCLTSLLCFPILFSSSFFAPQQISSFPSHNILLRRVQILNSTETYFRIHAMYISKRDKTGILLLVMWIIFPRTAVIGDLDTYILPYTIISWIEAQTREKGFIRKDKPDLLSWGRGRHMAYHIWN